MPVYPSLRVEAGFLVAGGPNYKRMESVSLKPRRIKFEKKQLRLSYLLAAFCFFLPALTGWAEEGLEA